MQMHLHIVRAKTRKVVSLFRYDLSTYLRAKHTMRAHECNNEIKTLLLRSACGARSSLILKKKIISYGKEKEGEGKEKEGSEAQEAPLVPVSRTTPPHGGVVRIYNTAPARFFTHRSHHNSGSTSSRSPFRTRRVLNGLRVQYQGFYFRGGDLK